MGWGFLYGFFLCSALLRFFYKKIFLNQIPVLIAPDASIPNVRASYSEYVSLFFHIRGGNLFPPFRVSVHPLL